MWRGAVEWLPLLAVRHAAESHISEDGGIHRDSPHVAPSPPCSMGWCGSLLLWMLCGLCFGLTTHATDTKSSEG